MSLGIGLGIGFQNKKKSLFSNNFIKTPAGLTVRFESDGGSGVRAIGSTSNITTSNCSVRMATPAKTFDGYNSLELYNITATDGLVMYIEIPFSTPISVSAFLQNCKGLFFCSDMTKFSNIGMRLYNASGAYYNLDYNSETSLMYDDNSWNQAVYFPNSVYNTGQMKISGTPTWDTFTKARFYFKCSTPASSISNGTVFINAFKFGEMEDKIACLYCDDGADLFATEFQTVLDSLGIKANLALISGILPYPEAQFVMTESQINYAISKGHKVVCHADNSSVDWITMTESQLRADLDAWLAYCRTSKNYVPASANLHAAYPLGYYNSTVKSVLAEYGVKTSRNYQAANSTAPERLGYNFSTRLRFQNPLNLKIATSTYSDRMRERVERCGGLLVRVTHAVGAANPASNGHTYYPFSALSTVQPMLQADLDAGFKYHTIDTIYKQAQKFGMTA